MQLISDTLIQKGIYLTVEIYILQWKDYYEGFIFICTNLISLDLHKWTSV